MRNMYYQTDCLYSFAPSGREYGRHPTPRALPWADVSLPLRGASPTIHSTAGKCRDNYKQ